MVRRWCLRLVCPVRRGVGAPGRVEEQGAWTTGVRGEGEGRLCQVKEHVAATSLTADLAIAVAASARSQ